MKRLLFLLAVPLAGCATIVIPPANPVDPVPVFIADYGKHSSLVFPAEDGRLVEFGYGQFDWYALEKDEWWRVPGLLFVPQQGTLCREEWAGPATEAGVDKGRRWLEEILRVDVARADEERVLARLEARFAAGASNKVRNPNYRLWFVFDDDLYWVGHSCNAAVADWLEELGCTVPARTVTANYRVLAPGTPAVEEGHP